MTCREQREREKKLVLKKKIVLEWHRKLWSYIADESERTGVFVEYWDAYKALWPNEPRPRESSMYWIGCEVAREVCCYCPVDWGNQRMDQCENALCHFFLAKANRDLQRYIEIARKIANLPERKYQFERSWTDVFAVAVLCAGIVMYILAMFQ